MRIIKNRPSFDYDEEEKKSSSDFDNARKLSIILPPGDLNKVDPEIIQKEIDRVRANFNSMSKDDVINACPEDIRDLFQSVNDLKHAINMTDETIDMLDLDDIIYSAMKNYVNKLSVEKLIKSYNREDENENFKSIITSGEDDIDLEDLPWNEAFHSDYSINAFRKANTNIKIYCDENLGKRCKKVDYEKKFIYVGVADISIDAATAGDLIIELNSSVDEPIDLEDFQDMFGTKGKEWIEKWKIKFIEGNFIHLTNSLANLCEQYNSDPISDLGDIVQCAYDTANSSIYGTLEEEANSIQEIMDQEDGEELMKLLYDKDISAADFNETLESLNIDDSVKEKYRKKETSHDDVKDILLSKINEDTSINAALECYEPNDDYPSMDVKYLHDERYFAKGEVKLVPNLEKLFIKDFKFGEKFVLNDAIKMCKAYYGDKIDFAHYYTRTEIIPAKDERYLKLLQEKFILTYSDSDDPSNAGIFVAFAKDIDNEWVAYCPVFSNGFNPETLLPYNYYQNPEYFDSSRRLKCQSITGVITAVDNMFWIRDNSGTVRISDLGMVKLNISKTHTSSKYKIGSLYFNKSEFAAQYKQDFGIDKYSQSIDLFIEIPAVGRDIHPTMSNVYMWIQGLLLNTGFDVNNNNIIKYACVKNDGEVFYITLDLMAYLQYCWE